MNIWRAQLHATTILHYITMFLLKHAATLDVLKENAKTRLKNIVDSVAVYPKPIRPQQTRREFTNYSRLQNCVNAKAKKLPREKTNWIQMVYLLEALCTTLDPRFTTSTCGFHRLWNYPLGLLPQLAMSHCICLDSAVDLKIYLPLKESLGMVEIPTGQLWDGESM